jgi:hypothetical protein
MLICRQSVPLTVIAASVAVRAEVVGRGHDRAPEQGCHTRLTITRAVSGFSALAIRSATSRRPLPGVWIAPPNFVISCRNPRGTGLPARLAKRLGYQLVKVAKGGMAYSRL